MKNIHLRTAEIDKAEYDPEAAHGLEDDLLWDFVRFVAGECQDDEVREVALAIVKWDEDRGPFERWYA